MVGTAFGHEVRPGFLQITEQPNHHYDVLWKQPTTGTMAVHLVPHIGGLLEGPPSSVETAPNFQISLWHNLDAGPQGLNGKTLQIEGLDGTIIDVLVRIESADGTGALHLLKPSETSFVIQKDSKNRIDIGGYVGLGIGHILYGIDHLLFVLGLLLIARGPRLLLKTITAFTIAHTITLGLAAFGVVQIAPTPVEAVIALSIVFLAVELAQHERGKLGLTYRQPWIVAFAFGLLHGFGFAGTLSRLGIPSGDIPQALLFFNLGVEAGQIGFVAVFLTFVYSLRSLEIHWPAWARRIPAYGIGSVASFWLIQRCAIIF